MQDISITAKLQGRLDRLAETLMSKSTEPEPLNSRQESVELSTVASKLPGIATSADDLLEQLHAHGREQIAALTTEQYDAAVEKAVKDFYYNKAYKAFQKLWKECEFTTGHRYRDNACVACGKPRGSDAEDRRSRGVYKLALKLREADKKAGIEYIPRIKADWGTPGSYHQAGRGKVKHEQPPLSTVENPPITLDDVAHIIRPSYE